MATYSPRLALFTKLHLITIFFLILMGALVKSHDAGLAVPDWPTTFGQNMFLYPPSEWVGGIFYEHFHRLVASFVGLLTVIVTFWLFKVESRAWVRYLGYLSLLAVVLQGLLGGLTVLWNLPPLVSIAHGVLAQTYLIICLIITYSQTRECIEGSSDKPTPPIFWTSIIAIAIIMLQLILGAIVRHTGSGLAIPDFPTMGGRAFPLFTAATMDYINDLRFQLGLRPATTTQAIIHLLHRLGAILVTVILVMLYLKSRINGIHPAIKTVARRNLVLLLLQWTLGMYTIWSVKEPYITSMHVLVGALLLTTTTFVALRIKFLKDVRL